LHNPKPGYELVLKVTPDFTQIEKQNHRALTLKEKSDYIELCKNIFNRRLKNSEVLKYSVTQPEEGFVEIKIFTLGKPDAVQKEILMTGGGVELRLVDDEYSEKANDWVKSNKSRDLSDSSEAGPELTAALMASKLSLPDHLEILYYYDRISGSDRLFPAYPLAVSRAASLTGEDFMKVWTERDPYGAGIIGFKTSINGASKLSEATRPENRRRKLAIVINRMVRSAPVINTQITGGRGIINGNFTEAECRALAALLKSGVIPFPLVIAEEKLRVLN
jgi:preprotein translocase subunit SecD